MLAVAVTVGVAGQAGFGPGLVEVAAGGVRMGRQALVHRGSGQQFNVAVWL